MALKMFPQELWELILENLESSQDILNAFKAFPELQPEGVLKKKLHIWLFEQVIPFVFPWLKKTEVLSCRAACKKWTHAVDNFLDNHPWRRPYSHGEHILGQHFIPEASPSHYDLCDHFGLFKVGHFKISKRLIKFLELQPPERNPVVGRYLDIHDGLENDGSDDYHTLFWTGVMNLLQKFGTHIWFLEIGISSSQPDIIPVPQMVVNILGLVPNLKGLSIYFPYYSSMSFEELLGPGNATLPSLPQLETLYLDRPVQDEPRYEPDSQIFINAYSTTIRRLCIRHLNWKKEYSHIFPNLTELKMWDIPTAKEPVDFLQDINVPALYRFELSFGSWSSLTFNGGITSWLNLKMFPKLHSLELTSSYVWVDNGKSSVVTEFCPSLKSLTLMRSSHFTEKDLEWQSSDFNFLRCFPSLEYFKFTTVIQRRNGTEKMRKLAEAEVWELLPKLRTLTIVDYITRKTPFCHTRARYEHLKRKKELLGDIN